MSDAIPTLARDVLRLFEDQLADHRFGDLDAEALEAQVREAEARARAVSEARAALEAAQAELEEARGALVRRAEQALAYARIHGVDAPDVAAAVAAIDEAHGEKKSPGRKRTRRKKAASPEPESAELPFARRNGAGAPAAATLPG